jgi:transposase InsO family protein
MPWEVASVSEIRAAFVHHVLTVHTPVAQACRHFGIRRKTGHKWLARYRLDPARPLVDHSRRPHTSPTRTAEVIANAVRAVRDQFGWGPRKIHAYLSAQGQTLPSARTVAAIRRRPARGAAADGADPPAVHYCERARPNELWQCDFKGDLEVARQRVYPFTLLDDHSRYLFTIHPCLDPTMQTAWEVLWQAFGDFGLPERLLCDNAFATKQSAPGLSWFDAHLVRLGIHPSHGRPYHPQTQGKIERFHRTLEEEVWPRVRRDDLAHFHADVDRWRTTVYNTVRPHQALGDVPPVTRWLPSTRPRPTRLPEVVYPPGSILRQVAASGDICWRYGRILVGQGRAGQWVRLEERGDGLALVYAWKEIRCVPTGLLRPRALR